MAPDGTMPPEVRALLHRALPTMLHVELLLLLARAPATPVDRHALATAVRSSPALVAGALAELESSGLVTMVAGIDPAQYRLAASDASLPPVIALLQEEYDRRPVTLIRVLYERPAPSPVQAFADAFRVRRDGEK